MIKSALGAVAALLTFGGAGMAGEVYVNPEVNTGFGTDSGFGSAIVEGHVGYDLTTVLTCKRVLPFDP